MSEVNKAQFELRHRYHSQGLAAGGSALLDAVNRGKVHLAKFILDAGEYDVVNTRDFKGKTPVIRTCYIKEEKTRGRALSLLLSRGANVNMQDESGRTALSYACQMRCNDVIRLLVQNNVDPDICDHSGNTALIHSAMVGNDTAIELLTKSFRRLGLNVDHVNNEGMTALLIAAKNGFIECATILALDGRACISFRDRVKGMTAEQWARAYGCSTPEVLPFSTGAAMWQYKMLRYGHVYSESCDVEDGAAGMGGVYRVRDKELRDQGEELDEEAAAADEARMEMGAGKTSDNRRIDVDDLSGRLMDMGSSKERPRSADNRSTLSKRGSLPSIKLTSPFQSKESTPLKTYPPSCWPEASGGHSKSLADIVPARDTTTLPEVSARPAANGGATAAEPASPGRDYYEADSGAAVRLRTVVGSKDPERSRADHVTADRRDSVESAASSASTTRTSLTSCDRDEETVRLPYEH